VQKIGVRTLFQKRVLTPFLLGKWGNGDVTTFSWDYRHRLTEAKRTVGTTVTDDNFTYDVWNRRNVKGESVTGSNAVTIATIYDGANPYDDFTVTPATTTLATRYLYGTGIDQIFARYDGSNVDWYLTDRLGSVVDIVRASNGNSHTTTYDSFGQILSENGSLVSGDRFKYTAREWDGGIGQYFYRARYYSPSVGRFESEDPIGFWAGDTNLNRYVFNSPSNDTDPSGLGPYDYFDWIGRLIGNRGSSEIDQKVKENQDRIAKNLPPIEDRLPKVGLTTNPYQICQMEPGGRDLIDQGLGRASFLASAGAAWYGIGFSLATPKYVPRFITGVKVVEKNTGKVLEGTVDLGPTLRRIQCNRKLTQFKRDGSVFKNKGNPLPPHPEDPEYYTEWVVETPTFKGPGPQRVIVGKGGQIYYTSDHYETFVPVSR
jgi:RHS repeat-associated protein